MQSRPAILALILTLSLGVMLRQSLAGGPLLPGGFLRWRMVHSHLGYFAVLFPLLWPVWRDAGWSVPGRRVSWAYGAATAVAIAGFVVDGGYGPAAMAGSTGVLLVWLRDAWTNRLRTLERGWGAATPVGLLAAACLIPAIAVSTSRDPELARSLLHGFRACLILGVVLPGALMALGLPAPPPGWWLGATLASAAWLGPAPWWALRVGPVLFAGLLAGSLVGLRDWDRRVGWGAVAGGLLALGLGIFPHDHIAAVGSLHFLVLGPILDGLLGRGEQRPWVRWLTLVAAAAMGAALVAQSALDLQAGPMLAAGAGTLLGAGWLVRLVRLVRAASMYGAKP